MSDGEIVKLIQQNVKNNVLVAFSGQISAFNKIRIGVIHGTTKTPYIEIDNTNVRVYIGENYQTYPHGLTIANNIQVLLDVDFYIDQTYGALCLRRIILCSNGVFAAEMNNKNWTGDNNQYFVESVGSSLGNCSFGWSCKALESKVWIFGDSWVSMYPQRWVFQAVKKGLMSKTLVNGYAGQGSQDALVSLKNLLEIGCPQYIVWCFLYLWNHL